MRTALLLALALVVGSGFAGLPGHSAPPIDPPGEALTLTPPAAPKEDRETEPQDQIKPPPGIAILAEVEGKIQADPVIALEPNKLLRLRVIGEPLTPAEDKKLPEAQWTRNRAVANWVQHDVVHKLGEDRVVIGYDYEVTMTGEPGVVYLLQVSISNPDPIKPPFVAQRWVVVGNGPRPPPEPTPVPPGPGPEPSDPSKVTQVTYVYEKDRDGEPSSGVMAALDKLNRQGIVATKFEDDTTDGDGDVPSQYAVALKAAKEKGEQAALVVQAGATVKSVWHNIRTEADVLEAVK